MCDPQTVLHVGAAPEVLELREMLQTEEDYARNHIALLYGTGEAIVIDASKCFRYGGPANAAFAERAQQQVKPQEKADLKRALVEARRQEKWMRVERLQYVQKVLDEEEAISDDPGDEEWQEED